LKTKNKIENNITKDQWYKHFQSLLKENYTCSNDRQTNHSTEEIGTNLNANHQDPELEITLEEITTTISTSKNKKSPCPDLITNEVLKSLPTSWLIPLKHIFNHILQSGEYPSSWSTSIIEPVYKSGHKNVPSNYRGISLISCLGKVLNSIIYKLWAETHNFIPKEQFGFRKAVSTSDAVFVLHTIAENQSLQQKNKLYCCFVDFKKAFDSVLHSLLWKKLSTMKLNPQILKVLQSYYSKSSSYVRGALGNSKTFSTSRGVKQGCNLSPLLFSLFINDLPNTLQNSPTLNQTNKVFPSSCILFADDLVIFSENPKELQSMHDQFSKRLLYYPTD
jgi:hypothetical protein